MINKLTGDLSYHASRDLSKRLDINLNTGEFEIFGDDINKDTFNHLASVIEDLTSVLSGNSEGAKGPLIVDKSTGLISRVLEDGLNPDFLEALALLSDKQELDKGLDDAMQNLISIPI